MSDCDDSYDETMALAALQKERLEKNATSMRIDKSVEGHLSLTMKTNTIGGEKNMLDIARLALGNSAQPTPRQIEPAEAGRVARAEVGLKARIEEVERERLDSDSRCAELFHTVEEKDVKIAKLESELRQLRESQAGARGADTDRELKEHVHVLRKENAELKMSATSYEEQIHAFRRDSEYYKGHAEGNARKFQALSAEMDQIGEDMVAKQFTIQDLQAQNDALQTEITTLKAAVAAASIFRTRPSVEEFAAQVGTLTGVIAALTTDSNEAKEKLAEAEEKLAEAKEKLAEAQDNYVALDGVVRQYLVRLDEYKHAGPDETPLIEADVEHLRYTLQQIIYPDVDEAEDGSDFDPDSDQA